MTITPLRSVSLAARVTTLLARTFPEYVPGAVHEGFRVESLDTAEPRRMFVRWHGGTPTRPVWTHGPAVGYFPRWPWTETVGQAITLLIDAGLPPVRYREEIGGGSVMCEGDGFLVSPENRVGVHLDTIGAGGADASDRAAEVLRAAGWRVEADTEWPGWYSAFPPGA